VRLFIDRGNTRTKAMLLPASVASTQPSLEALEVLPVHYLPAQPSAEDWSRILPDGTALEGVWICDAQAQPSAAADWSPLAERGPVYCLDNTKKPPFQVVYGGNLGPDRLALAWALQALQPKNDALALSVGTCLTVNAQIQGVFHGGPISPGLHLRLRAMHEQTAALPLAQIPAGPVEWTTPESTEGALQAGAFYGLQAEISDWVERWRTKSPEIVIYLTGGDVPTLATTLKKGIFAAPKLAFAGLWAWSNEGN
jgi:pantothenate kinase type III